MRGAVRSTAAAVMSAVSVGVGLGGLAGAAEAAVETRFTSFSATLNDFSGDVPFDYLVPLFNTQGGTRVLTDIQLSGTVLLTAETSARNVDVFVIPFTLQFAAGFNGSLPGGQFSAFGSDAQSESALLPDSVRMFRFELEAPIVAAAGNLSAWTSPTDATVTRSSVFTANLTRPPLSSSLEWTQPRVQMGGALQIQYVYEIVPAPGAGALVVCAAAAMTRRRRRRRHA